MQNDTTSRHWVMDALEAIKNLEATVSHCNEIMHSIYNNTWNRDNIDADLVGKYTELSIIKEGATKNRRFIMKYIFKNFEWWDREYRCILKHQLSALEFMEEVYDATRDVNLWDTITSIYNDMSMALTKFIWTETNVCARCALDEFLSDNSNNNGNKS